MAWAQVFSGCGEFFIIVTLAATEILQFINCNIELQHLYLAWCWSPAFYFIFSPQFQQTLECTETYFTVTISKESLAPGTSASVLLGDQTCDAYEPQDPNHINITSDYSSCGITVTVGTHFIYCLSYLAAYTCNWILSIKNHWLVKLKWALIWSHWV